MQQAYPRARRLLQLPQRLRGTSSTHFPRRRPTTHTLIQQRHYAWGEPDPEPSTPPTPQTPSQTPSAANTADTHPSPIPLPTPEERARLKPLWDAEHAEGLAWLRTTERAKILAVAGRLRLKKEHSLGRVKPFVESLLNMPEVQRDVKAVRKVGDALRALEREVDQVDVLLGRL